LRSIGLRRAALEINADDLDAGRKALHWGCSVCQGPCQVPEACELASDAKPARRTWREFFLSVFR
jgi:hypothetical protein